MAVNQKAVKVLNKILEAGFTDEKAIAAMTMDDILSMQGTRRRLYIRGRAARRYCQRGIMAKSSR